MDLEQIDALALFLMNSGKRYFMEKLTNSRTLFKVPIDEQEVLVIYDKNQHSLLTALPNKYEEGIE